MKEEARLASFAARGVLFPGELTGFLAVRSGDDQNYGRFVL